jgi:phage shock protein E
MSFLSKLFTSNSNTVSIADLLNQGAVIVDVRTKAEFNGAHLKNSINLPLDSLNRNLDKLDKSKPVITVCATGMRSGSARHILKSHGFQEVVNGGSWGSLKKYE